MLEEILPFIKNIKLINYNPESEVSFKKQFIKDWMLRGNNRVDAVFCEESIFFKTNIPTTARMKKCLVIDCHIKGYLKNPYVSLSKGSIILNTVGAFKKIDGSIIEGSEIDVSGSCFGSTFKNCKITKGTFTDCVFENCYIKDSTLIMCSTDKECILAGKTKSMGNKTKSPNNYNILKTGKKKRTFF